MYFIQFNDKIIFNSSNMLEAYSRLEEAAIDYAQSLGNYCTTIFKQHYSLSNSYYCMSNKLGEVEVWKVRIGTFYNSRTYIAKFKLVEGQKAPPNINFKKRGHYRQPLIPCVLEDLKNFLDLRESTIERNEN